MRRIVYLSLILFSSVTARAEVTGLISNLIVTAATSAEMEETVFEPFCLVARGDAPNDLRLGDGITPGGLRVCPEGVLTNIPDSFPHPVAMNGNSIALNGAYSVGAEGPLWYLRANGSNVLSVLADVGELGSIVSEAYVGSNTMRIVVSVEDSALDPLVEFSPSLFTPAWTDCVYSATRPSANTVQLDIPLPDEERGYYRITALSGFRVRIGIPLEAPSVSTEALTLGGRTWTNLPETLPESDPAFTNWLGTNTYIKSETDPVWLAEKSAYATGTPLYAFTEADPAFTNWLGTNTGTRIDATALTSAEYPTNRYSLYVSPFGSATNSGGSWSNAFREIQQAVNVSTGGQVIGVAPGWYSKFVATNLSGRIDGFAGPGQTIVDAGLSGRCALLGTNWSISGLRLTRGNLAADHGGGLRGGTASNCIIDRCSATHGGGAYEATLYDCTLEYNNGTTYAGGAYNCVAERSAFRYNYGLIYGGGAMFGTYTHCSFTANTARDYGGAIGAALSISAGIAPTSQAARVARAINCTMTGNAAQSYQGGALYGQGGTNACIADRCLIAGNYAPAQVASAGAYGSVLITNCLLADAVAGGAVVTDSLAKTPTETDPLFTGWLGSNSFVVSSTDSASGLSNAVAASAFVAGINPSTSESGPIALTTYDYWSYTTRLDMVLGRARDLKINMSTPTGSWSYSFLKATRPSVSTNYIISVGGGGMSNGLLPGLLIDTYDYTYGGRTNVFCSLYSGAPIWINGNTKSTGQVLVAYSGAISWTNVTLKAVGTNLYFIANNVTNLINMTRQ